MIHLRIVAPEPTAAKALEILDGAECVVNIVHLPGAARKPSGDVILCDVAREDASVVISDLKHLGIPAQGSIAVEAVDSEISRLADVAEEGARGKAADAVVWEEVEARTEENTELSGSFLAFMVLAMLIAACGIALDSPILIVGAMVVGPEFGPLAGLCVGLVEKRPRLARRSLAALAVGFPVGILATYLFTEALLASGLLAEAAGMRPHPLTEFIAEPSVYSAIVAVVAGTAGMLSLTTSKSGALIGVLISVTTIPAAANIGFAAAIGNWPQAAGAALQLIVNLTAIGGAGFLTLYLLRLRYIARRDRHLKSAAGKG
jgi:uncharacterized hydrophobic protein (TIGR00271 family)